MQGWKWSPPAGSPDVDAPADRFAALAFDDRSRPRPTSAKPQPATDRHRYRRWNTERVDARGGTELLEPLRQALTLLDDSRRDRVLVLVTDGQVGNEDQILGALGGRWPNCQVHVGIDEAVNAGFWAGWPPVAAGSSWCTASPGSTGRTTSTAGSGPRWCPACP
jgi:Ca-activated chloride channel family protein